MIDENDRDALVAYRMQQEVEIMLGEMVEFINEIKDRFDTQVKLMLLASTIDNRIEPHPISKEELQSNNPFVLEILRTGIKLNLK